MTNIELPMCKGSYSSDPTNEFTDDSFLDGVMQAIETQAREYRPFLLVYVTTVMSLGRSIHYNVVVVANLCPTAAENVRRKTGSDTSMCVRSSPWLTARMF